MVGSGSYLPDKPDRFRHRCLAVCVIAPSDNAAIRFHCDRMGSATGNVNHICQAVGNVALSCVVAPPSHNRAVALERDTVEKSSRDLHHVPQSCRHRRLAILIAAPRHYRAVFLQGQGVLQTRTQVSQTIQTGRGVRLSVGVVTPGSHHAVAGHPKVIKGPRRACRIGDRNAIGAAASLIHARQV